MCGRAIPFLSFPLYTTTQHFLWSPIFSLFRFFATCFEWQKKNQWRAHLDQDLFAMMLVAWPGPLQHQVL